MTPTRKRQPPKESCVLLGGLLCWGGYLPLRFWSSHTRMHSTAIPAMTVTKKSFMYSMIPPPSCCQSGEGQRIQPTRFRQIPQGLPENSPQGHSPWGAFQFWGLHMIGGCGIIATAIGNPPIPWSHAKSKPPGRCMLPGGLLLPGVICPCGSGQSICGCSRSRRLPRPRPGNPPRAP